MTKNAFIGSCVALITPFKNNKLDEKTFENIRDIIQKQSF